MTYSKLFSTRIPPKQLVEDIKIAIATIYALPPEEYNSKLFHDIIIGFKTIVSNMEHDNPSAFPLFLKWLKLYVRLQHQIDPKNALLSNKFENKLPLCSSYIFGSLQYQPKIANYHIQVLEMCLSLFNTTSAKVMQIIANFEMEVIGLLWMPIEFVGDYNTQKLSLKLIVTILRHLNEEDKRKRVAEINRGRDEQHLLLKLAVDDDNFEMISRELLNIFNMKSTQNCAVFSVYCTTALFGSFELSKPEKMDRFWIDFNYTSKSVSFLCRLKQGDRDPEELSIQIKIDKLQIDNQFDCKVFSIERAIFSADVPTELKNARSAVFTLPKNEVERLKANRHVIDFYSKSYNYSYSESDVTPTPNTIENYLADDNQMENDYLETSRALESRLLQRISPIVMLSNLSKNQIAQMTGNKTNDITSRSDLNSTVIEMPVTNQNSSVQENFSLKKLHNSGLSTKESGYNTGTSMTKHDSKIFKKPTNPVRQKTKEIRAPNKPSATVQSTISGPKQPQKPNNLPVLEDKNLNSSQSSEKSSRRFFKTSPTKPTRTDLEPRKMSRKRTVGSNGISPKQPQKPKNLPLLENKTPNASQLYEKSSRRFCKANATRPTGSKPQNRKQSRKRTGDSTGISPKRKQVNSSKPLIHLIQPDCDQEQVALELIENGGYANILRYLDSNEGRQCFTDPQRKNILKNIEIITENIERSAIRFFQKDANNDTDDDSIGKPTLEHKIRKSAPIVPQCPHFVPYTIWKEKQKDNAQSTMISIYPEQEKKKTKPTVPLNAFDQLKISSPESNGSSFSKPNTPKKQTSTNNIVASNCSSGSSRASSCSNHNFHIVESDHEFVDAYSTDGIIPVEMICRREVENVRQSPVPVPIEISQAKVGSWSKRSASPKPKMSFGSSGSDIFDQRSTGQMSKAYNSPQRSLNSPTQCTNEQHISDCESVRTSSPICHYVHPDSEVVRNTSNTWLIDKYLNGQQPPDQPKVVTPHATPPFCDLAFESNANSRPQNVTTNQLIIQNQIVVSTVRKRTDYEESSLANITSVGDHVHVLNGSAELLPKFKQLAAKENERLLNQLTQQLKADDKFNEVTAEVLNYIGEYETNIKEIEEQLSQVSRKLELLIENKSQLENIYWQLYWRLKASASSIEDGEKSFEKLNDEVKKFATSAASELWQNFANKIVNSVEGRMKSLVHL